MNTVDRTAALNSRKKTGALSGLEAWFQILAGSLFIALCSQVKIPLFFTPVPLTLQTFAVMLAAGFLGPSKGALAVMAYLCELAMGLPVSAGGAISPLALMGAKGGYFIGFVLQAYLVGWCANHSKQMSKPLFFGALATIAFLLLALGSLWLGAFVGFNNAFAMGFLPFIPGELLKVAAVAPLILQWRR